MSWPVHRVMSLIGSASGCKFRLTDPSVSRFHGSLLRTSAGVWIVDLLGQGGITVNEVPVRSHRLMDGDVLGIGRYQIRIRCRLQDHGSENGSPDRGRSTLVAGHRGRTVPRIVSSFPIGPRRRCRLKRSPRARRRHNSLCRSQPVSSFPNVEIMSSDSVFPVQSGTIRVDRIGAGAFGQSIRPHAATDVRSVSAGHGHDGPDVRDDAPRSDGGDPRGTRQAS